MTNLEQVFAEIEAVLERLISQQRTKVAEVAQDIVPTLSREQEPEEFTEIAGDAMYNFEDGFLAGLLSARMALRSNVFEPHRGSGA